MKPFLSICMIVKNEENLLRRCLDSIKGIADEIIIADTGSVDKTKDIALEYTDMVFDYTWEDDFSKARNFAASKASGEWIFVIDADEFVDRDSFIKFKEDLKNNPPDYNILAVQIVNFVGINGKDTSLNYHERLYKNDGLISYYRSIHELLKHKESKERRGFSDFQIYHSGYMKNIINEKEKSNRNLTLLKKKKEKEPIDYYFLGNEYDQLGDLDKAIKYYQKGFQLKDDLNKDWVKKLLLRLVNTLHKANRNKEALEIIDSCEQIYPYLVDFKFYRGKIHFDEEDYENAKEVFEEILRKKNELKADSSNDFLEYLPYKLLGEIYESENELHSAVYSYSKALSINDADDFLWIRLIDLLAKHSTLEELVGFLNNNLVNKQNITSQRVIKILLSVPNINVQKLTRLLLEKTELTRIEKEALYIKNLYLDRLNDDIIGILNKKTSDEIISLLSVGIFNIIDFILFTMELDIEIYKNIIGSINFDKPIENLLNLLFTNKSKKLSLFEQEFFILIMKQSYTLQNERTTNLLKEKLYCLDVKSRNQIQKELRNSNLQFE
ncbi:glycosyltransferase [Caldifermentibacillus hisashii]|uniref:tetratricopeptide repeat-containing glycosyltransferase family 2 protein n=1 Tax=Caldifermentibacillus hisashii TaxID=996558 RepID=UPI003D1E9603